MTVDYAARRQKLAKSLPKNSVALLTAAQEHIRNGDAHYRFRQDSYFYYLTGFNEADAWLLIRDNGETMLFNQPKCPEVEQWTGARLGQEDALATLKVDRAFNINELDHKLPDMLANTDNLYYLFDSVHQAIVQQPLQRALDTLAGRTRQGISAPRIHGDLAPILGEQRLFKTPDEIACMRHAIEASAQAHRQAMQACSNLNFEYELEAVLWYEIMRTGCRGMAYDPIVGSGANACVLHYTANNAALKPGDLVLIDAGGEYENYAADITRTFPINGTFSAPQRAIYELVLRAQKAAIASLRPGISWETAQGIIVQVLTEGLVKLGLLKGNVDTLIESKAYRRFYMHQSGHWLGLDVHDAGAYKEAGVSRPLQPGMVLTVEPGLYIPGNCDDIDEKWWHIGVRIEDDILITDKGYDILSRDVPVEPDEIEALIRG